MENEKDITDAEKKVVNDQERFLQFDLGPESYAVQLLRVKEVIPHPETTPLPNSPSHYVGIMNLRGQIISIVDLRKKLGITPKEEGLEEAVVIVEFESVGVGVIVDSINRVLNISSQQITMVPEVKSQVNSQYIQGVYQGDEKLTILLDLENVLNLSKLKEMQKKAA